MKGIIFSILLLVSLAACDKAKEELKKDSSTVDGGGNTVGAKIIDSAIFHLEPATYTEPEFTFGPYVSVAADSGGPLIVDSYFDMTGDVGMRLPGITDIFNSNSFTVVMVLQFTDLTVTGHNLFGYPIEVTGQTNLRVDYLSQGFIRVEIKKGVCSGVCSTYSFQVPTLGLAGKNLITITFENMNDFSSLSVEHNKVYINETLMTGSSMSMGSKELDSRGNLVVVSDRITNVPKLESTQSLNIGTYPTMAGAGVVGKFYHFGVFNKSLSAAEVTQLVSEINP